MDADTPLPWRAIRPTGFNAHVGPIRFAPLGDGRYLAELEIREIHINSGGVCHGGALMTLADVAMGTASFEAAGGHGCATIAFDAQFLAAAKLGQVLRAEATQHRRVRDLSFMGCTLMAGGRVVMRANGIWKHLESRAPAE